MLHTMPMNCGVHGQLVLHKDLELVPLIDFDQRRRLLAIDKVDFSSNTIYVLLAS